MFDLPTESAEFEELMPSRLVLGSHQGTGKTTAATLLPNCLVLDLEGGAIGYGGTHFNLKAEMLKYNAKLPKDQQPLTLVGAFNMFVKSLKEANAKSKDGYAYDFLAIDTTTAFQVIAAMKATSMFRKTIIGQGMEKKGVILTDVVSELPEGGGYLWLHKAWNELYSECTDLTRYGTIFMAHTKQSSLVKNGQNITVKDLDITGKLKLELLRDVQAAGYLWRTDENTVIVSFKNDERDLTTKSRCAHLANKEFVFSKMNPETGELTVYWNLIYPDWVKEPIIKKIKQL